MILHITCLMLWLSQAPPIVRVALDCDISSLAALRRGLQRLSQADPCVEVYLQVRLFKNVEIRKCNAASLLSLSWL